MKRRLFGRVLDDVLAKIQSVNAFGVYEGFVKGNEFIVLNDNTGCPFPSVEVLLASLEVRNLRLDGDNGLCELEETGQGIQEFVVSNLYVAACSGFVPTVTVSAEEYGCT